MCGANERKSMRWQCPVEIQGHSMEPGGRPDIIFSSDILPLAAGEGWRVELGDSGHPKQSPVSSPFIM